MIFSELPVSIKKEFLSIKDETATFDDLVKNLIKNNKKIFFSMNDEYWNSKYYFYDNKWHDVKKEGYNKFTYKKINEYGKFDTLDCDFNADNSLHGWILKKDLEIYFAKDNESNEYYLIVDDYNFEINVKKNTLKTIRNPKFYLLNEENKSKIEEYINKIKHFDSFIEDLGITNKRISMSKSIILDLYLDIRKGDKRAKALTNYNLTDMILLKSDLTTAYSFFDNNGNLKIEEWLFDLKCNSVKKIKKYETWIKKYKLNKDDLLEIDCFLNSIPDKYITKINSILSKKDNNRKNYYTFKETINYIKNQMLNNFLELEETIDSFHNSVNNQIKKYDTIKNKFPENIVTYSKFINCILNSVNDYDIPNLIFEQNNLKLFCVGPQSIYLLNLSEMLQLNLVPYCNIFHKNIYMVSNENKITKIFDLNISNKPDNRFYDTGEDVDDFVNEALKELLKNNI